MISYGAHGLSTQGKSALITLTFLTTAGELIEIKHSNQVSLALLKYVAGEEEKLCS